jgi:hypothetical protein
MKHLMHGVLAGTLALAATTAWASYHTFQIDEIFTNADGTIQYVVLHEAFGMDGQNMLLGHTLTATQGTTTKTYNFQNDLPGGSCSYYGCTPSPTAHQRVLIASQSFAALGLVNADYVIPDGFIPLSNGTLNYAQVDQMSYTTLPTDGVSALMRSGATGPNVATNFAGGSASVAVAAAVDLNQHGLTGLWFEPATRGQGLDVQVFPDQLAPGTGSIFVSWFTFDNDIGGAEHQRWYTLQGNVMSGQPSASLTIYQNAGGNFDAPPKTAPQSVGSATISFATCTSGQLSYTFTDGTGRNGNVALTRLMQNVTCSTTGARPTDADFALSGNWDNPDTSGQGFGVEVNANSSTLFSAWYTYAPNGAGAGAAGQRWYTAQAAFAPGSRSIPVKIYETTGGVFDTPTVPPPGTVQVGTGTIAFQSCSGATFNYSFTGGSSSQMSRTISLSRVGPVPPGCTF